MRVLSAREARTNAEMQLEASSVCTRWAARRRSFCSNVKTRWRMRASELRAETDYNKALADLQRATSTTLRANNVVVDAPTGP